MRNLTHCVLTGEQLEQAIPLEEPTITYHHGITGKVVIALDVIVAHQNLRSYQHPILAGLCRNAYEDGVDPPLIDASFKITGVHKLDFPKTFKEKAMHLLKYMHAHGGNDYTPFRFDSYVDRSICYCDDHFEMNRLLEHLEKKGWIEIGFSIPMAQDITNFGDVVMTDGGIAEVERELPQIPMLGLVTQEIATGDVDTDAKINHARQLFFSEPSTMEHMRSACVALCAVLEPIRYELTPAITTADVNDLFLLVNKFDIRHSKGVTNLIYPEQLEWVFYSLLNTINTYTKLKKRLNP